MSSAFSKEHPLKKSWTISALGAAALVAAALGMGIPAANAAPSDAGSSNSLHAVRVCSATVALGEATCHAEKLVNSNGVTPAATQPPAGALTPAQIRSAYGLNNTSGAGRTVAIVDAYGYTNLEADLATYRSHWVGMPACTIANGCLRIIDQNGGSNLPRMDVGWAQEQALDVDAVSATCPDCKIVVVQAKSASFANLGAAVIKASQQPGVVAISNSYGGGDASDTTYGTYYNHPGIAVTASTGDNGYKGGSYPASSSYVTAVGGTSLSMSGTTRVSESAWSGAGSGCSSYNVAIAPFSMTGCNNRAMADVSAAADPGVGGMAVFAPTSRTSSTWSQYGGTSESSPIIASVYALAGGGYSNATPYAHAGSLFDVTTGSNGNTCPVSKWCHAVAGWDGPTGLGTPNGTGAF
jgi:subtilase family serine protease